LVCQQVFPAEASAHRDGRKPKRALDDWQDSSRGSSLPRYRIL
jgi:hypothetical protein